MFRKSPQITAAISNVCRDAATKVVLELPELEYDLVSPCLERVHDFLQNNQRDLGAMECIFKLDFSGLAHAQEDLTVSSLCQNLGTGANIIIIDENLKIKGLDSIPSTALSELSQYSKSQACCIIHVFSGVEMVIYANGLIKNELNALRPLRGPVTHKKTARHGNDYILSILEHYQKRIRYPGIFSDHWENRQNRVLKNSPKKTEKIFHDNLWGWLLENLEYAVVSGNVGKVTGDETDIEISIHGEPRFYIIEVKWLGTNGYSKHSEPRLRDGITQVKEYLERDPAASEACLVAYDGRDMEKFEALGCCDYETEQWKEIRTCQTAELPPRGKGFVFYLESQSASEKRR